jgi:DNA-directed RNA polymerase subunit RPC12/RpoP
MKNKNKLWRLRALMVIMGIPVTALQWISIVLWITKGIWWPFVLWLCVDIPWGVWVTLLYFRKVDYICPECHTVFKPRLKQAFFANHTPTTRKLTCPHCGHKGFCVEVYTKENKEE